MVINELRSTVQLMLLLLLVVVLFSSPIPKGDDDKEH
jgi:hypothetical protein